MFHLLLVLPVIIIGAALLGLVVFAIIAAIGALVGGAAIAVLVRDGLVKKILLLIVGIVFSFGLLFAVPLLAAASVLPVIVLTLAAWGIFLLAAFFAAQGVKAASMLTNKTVSALLKILFAAVLIASVVFALVVGGAGFMAGLF